MSNRDIEDAAHTCNDLARAVVAGSRPIVVTGKGDEVSVRDGRNIWVSWTGPHAEWRHALRGALREEDQ